MPLTKVNVLPQDEPARCGAKELTMSETPACPPVIVVAAILVEQGRVLVTQRPEGKHLAGAWEFPGGKVEPGEEPRCALERELAEELGIATTVGDIVDVTFHRYPGKDVLLLFYATRRLPSSPQPEAREVAAIAWRAAGELQAADFPPADAKILGKVRGLLSQA
jgi:8-oxo-dGTP diphosphatase